MSTDGDERYDVATIFRLSVRSGSNSSAGASILVDIVTVCVTHERTFSLTMQELKKKKQNG